MAQITITVPQNIATRVLNSFSGFFNYQETINGLPNPETKAVFCQRMLRQYIIDCVRSYEKAQAIKEASNTTDADIVNNILLT